MNTLRKSVRECLQMPQSSGLKLRAEGKGLMISLLSSSRHDATLD